MQNTISQLSTLITLCKKPFQAIGSRGLRYALRSAQEIYFDNKYGISTRGTYEIEDIETVNGNAKNGNACESAGISLTTRMLKKIPEVMEYQTFIDYGCGMGRAMILAALHGYKKIIGIEYSKKNYNKCVQNINSFKEKNKNRATFEVCNMDALDFEIPTDACVFFFFNPFDRKVTEIILNKLETSIEKFPRTAYIAFVNIQYPELFIKNETFISKKCLDNNNIVYSTCGEF